MFLAHARLLDCMLLPLFVTWVPTMSRPWKMLGATRWKPFFKLQNQGTVTVYDPPHLLKCTRNLSLKYDVQFKSECMHNQLPATAKWEHILSVY